MNRLLYILKLALIDAWKNKLSLNLLCSSCLIASLSLMSISSVKEDLNNSIQTNTKSLLGADFLITNRSQNTKNVKKLFSNFDTILNTKTTLAEEISFSAMVLFEKNQNSRLVQLSGITTNYPLYGEIKSTNLKSTDLKSGTALVDNSLKYQYNIEIGDKIKIGKLNLEVGGFIIQMPGSISARSILAPRVLINIDDISKTELIQKGSVFRELYYFSTKNLITSKKIKSLLEKQLKDNKLDFESSEERGERLQKNVSNVYNFFDIVILSSFVLSGIGIGSGSYIYFKQKLNFINILLCLGLKTREAALFLSFQILFFGIISIFLGSIAGSYFQKIIPLLLKNFMPLELSNHFSLKIFLNSIFTSLFLLSIFVTIAAFLIYNQSQLKSSLNKIKISNRFSLNKFKIFKFTFPIIIFFLIIIWAQTITKDYVYAATYSTAILFLLCIFSVCGLILRSIANKYSKNISLFSLQQGIRNLYRPNNQVASIFSAVGFSTFLIFLIFYVGDLSKSKITKIDNSQTSNLLLFDIQPEQLNDVKSLLTKHKLNIFLKIPIVNMRIEKLNNQAIKDFQLKKEIPDWTVTREYRSTYRNNIEDTEKLISGNFISNHNTSTNSGDIPVSIEKGILEKLGLKLGDTITFNVQGIEINSYISSVRQVDWQQIKPNFFFVFPEGVLEGAPKTFILTSRYESEKENSLFQVELINKFGNISTIDLSLVLTTLESISHQLRNIIFFLSSIIILTALFILSTIIWGSRISRIEENTIFKILGAKDKVIFEITIFEYMTLSFLSTISGFIFSIISAYLIGNYTFAASPDISWKNSLAILFLINIFIILLGVIGSIGTLRKSSMMAIQDIE